MENKSNHLICRRCNGNGKPSKTLRNYHYIDKSYLRGETEFETKLIDCIKCEKCGHSWVPETSPRELAIEWWKSLFGTGKQLELCEKYFPHYLESNSPVNSSPIGREIEEIWKKETEHGKQVQVFNEFMKPNQKQFKQFDESLFKAYISKFNITDKCIMLKVLNEEINKEI